MVQVKVIIVGTSPAETLRVEEALNQAGCLEAFRYVGLEQALDRVPDWDGWDLLIARYHERSGQALLSLLAPALRKLSPPVIFLVDQFEPILVNRLLNNGIRRVFPVDQLEQMIATGLDGALSPDLPAASTVSDKPGNGRLYNRQTKPVSGTIAFPSSGGLAEGFARLFHSSPIGISINRLSDGVCLDCNDSFSRMLECSREELIGHVSLELGITEDVHKFFEVGEKAAIDVEQPPTVEQPAAMEQEQPAATEQPVVQDQPAAEELKLVPEKPAPATVMIERKIYTRSRQILHVQVHLDLIEWAGETCVLSIIQDITEKEQAKEKINRLNDELERLVLVRTGALEAANRELAAEIGRRKVLEDFSNQLSQIIWQTPDVVAISAPDGRMQFLNKAGRVLFGLSEDEPVSHLDLFSAYPEPVRVWIRTEILPQLIQDGIWHGEAAFQLSGGRVIPLSQVLLCKKDDAEQVQYFASIARDVSDYKRVEQELRQSRERYRNLAEAAHDFIFMVSGEGLMEYANEYACQALGFDPNKIYGIPATQFFPKEFADNHLQMFSEVHEIDRPIYTEGPFQRDEQESWLGTWLVPIHSEDGSLVSILGISRDITEQKKTDEALQRALQNERKLGEMRSNFFSMTSHQFRTPLSTILLSAELLQKYGPKWDDQKRSEHLGRIQEAAKRLNAMLEDILVIGRVESGRYICTPKDFDLIQFCEDTIREITLNDRGEHELIFQHTEESLPVFQDPEVMHRVIDNLLSNAIKYSPKGKHVMVAIKQEDQHVLLEVSDQGIGIPERDLKYLFQPFQRGSNASDIPGTGIGLTIIQKSVELMNGIISLKSKEGQGTTFIVRFPSRFESDSDRMLA